MKTISRNSVLVTAVTVVSIFGFAYGWGTSPAFAQESGSSKSLDLNSRKVSVDVESGDVKAAIKLLFQSVEVNYTISADVQGPITVHLQDVSFKTALESMLKSATLPLTYRVENGIYSISLKNESSNATIENGKDLREDVVTNRKSDKIISSIKLNFVDPEDIAKFFGGSVLVTRFGGSSALMSMGNRNGQGAGMGNGAGNGQSGTGNSFSGSTGGSFGSNGASIGGSAGSGSSFGNPGGSGPNNRR